MWFGVLGLHFNMVGALGEIDASFTFARGWRVQSLQGGIKVFQIEFVCAADFQGVQASGRSNEIKEIGLVSLIRVCRLENRRCCSEVAHASWSGIVKDTHTEVLKTRH